MVQLLPNGGFLIEVPTKDGSGTIKIKGKFDMQAIEEFCKAKDIPGLIMLGQFFKTGMMPSHYAQFILCAVHRTYADKSHCDFTIEDVYEWITALGGFASNDFEKLIANGMRLFVKFTDESYDSLQLTDEEKKILRIGTAGKIFDLGQSGQG